MKIQIDLRKVVFALSDALDLVGVDDIHHGKRVGLMARECGRKLGLGEADRDTLFDAGLLHDCGVSSTSEHRRLVTELDWRGAQDHCDRGSVLLESFEPLARLAPLILYHHTHWDTLSKMAVAAEVTLLSNLIFLVDRVDALTAPHYNQPSLLYHKEGVRKTIARHSGVLFAPQLVEAFLQVSRNEAFWLCLESLHIHQYLGDMARHRHPMQISFEQLKQLAGVFSRIVDAKSAFTVEHSTGVSTLARFLGEQRGLSVDTCEKLEIAGLLHDLGKLRVPDEILDKPGPLDEEERAIMARHSFESYQILRRIPGMDDIARWAAYHHEGPDGKGYPFHCRGKNLPLEARIIAVADVFQAMAQKRPYRGAMPPQEILRHLRDLGNSGHMDTPLVELVGQHLDACWQKATCAKATQPPHQAHAGS